MKRRSFLQAMMAGAATVPAIRPVTALAQGSENDTLAVAIVSDPVTLDPALMASFFELSVQYNLFEPLLDMTPDLKIKPGLATPKILDETTYRLTLRDGLTFQDGTKVNAKALKANFDRMLDPKMGSPRADELGPIDTITINDPLTITIKMKSPYAPFLHVLSNRAGMMVSPTAVEKLGPEFASKAVGAGPYKVLSWNKNSRLVLEAFKAYWRGEVPIKKVVFRPIPGDSERLTNLRSNTVDLIDSVPPQNLKQIQRLSNLTMKRSGGLGFNAFSFNMTAAPFDDPTVRKAFTLAVDPNVVKQAAYFGTGSVSYGPIPPTMKWAFDPTLKPKRGDPAAAKKMLADAGKSGDVPVEITVTNSPIYVRTAEIIQAQVRKAGFDAKIKQVDSTSLITVLRARTFDLCMSPWSGRSDPDGNMYNYFTIDGSNNFAGYKSRKVDSLLKKARIETDKSKRAELYHQAQDQIAKDAPVLFLTFPATLQASRSNLDWLQYPDGSFRLQFAKFA